MKKNQARSPLPYKTVFVCLFALVVTALLASCEMQSIVDHWRDDDADTVYHSLEVTTTSPLITTTLPPATDPPTTTEPPPVTTTAPPTTTQPPVTAYAPLTGLPTSPAVAASRPLAFCVKNAVGSTIAAADLVIEAPTEASSTRLLLLKSGGESLFSELGIASIRPYMAALSHDFFGLSVYLGTSDIGRESASFLYETVDLSLTSVTEGDPASLETAIAAAGHETVVSGSIALPYTLADVGTTVAPKEATSSYVSISYNATAATAFTYDALTGTYTMRSGTALAAGDAALPSFKNLLVLFFDSTRRVGRDGVELTLDTELGGTGYYVTEGGVMSIFWRRDPMTSRLYITDKDGIPITVNRGKTYLGMTTYEHRDNLILN